MGEPGWHVSVGGKQRGPFSLERLRKIIESGGLADDATVRRDDWDQWKPWRAIPALVQPAAPAASAERQAVAVPPSAAGAPEVRRPPVWGLGSPEGGDRAPLSRDKLIGYLTFREMVTPVVILVVYWVGVAAIVLYGLVSLASSGLAVLRGGAGGALFAVMAVAASLILLPVAVVMWRVYCEVIAVLFRIYETLTEINAKLGRTGD